MKKKRKPIFFRLIERFARIIYGKYEVLFLEPINNTGSILVANHSQIYGPIASYLYYPNNKKIWVIGQMTKLKEVPSYAMEDFWRDKSKFIKWFYKLLSYLIAPISVYIMKHANTIGVYKDMRITQTLRDTINTLASNRDVIIFPEYREKYNSIINDFQMNYIEVARMYYKKYNKELKFYPVYVAKSLRKIMIGKPIQFNHQNNIKNEKIRINEYLKENITTLALNLARHKIIPYTNGKKREYTK